jgi:hypothetical protein
MKKDVLDEVELYETSAVGTPAYQRAVTKSFSMQAMPNIKKDVDVEMNKDEKIETIDTGKPSAVKPEVKPETPKEEPKKEEPKKEEPKKAKKDEEPTEEKVEEPTTEKLIEDVLNKSEKFEKLIEKKIEEALSKKSKVEEQKEKFPAKKPGNIGELGASFMRQK